MPDFYYAKPGPIAPIALVGQRMAIWSAPRWTAYVVEHITPIHRGPTFVFDLGAIAANTPLALAALGALELSSDPVEMMQARFYPVDDIEVEVRMGQADFVFKTQNLICRADRFTRQVDPCLHQTEFAWLKEAEPQVQVTNPTDYALAVSRVDRVL